MEDFFMASYQKYHTMWFTFLVNGQDVQKQLEFVHLIVAGKFYMTFPNIATFQEKIDPSISTEEFEAFTTGPTKGGHRSPVKFKRVTEGGIAIKNVIVFELLAIEVSVPI